MIVPNSKVPVYRFKVEVKHAKNHIMKVDGNGKVVSAKIALKTTTTNRTIKNIAIEKAKQLKFPASQNDIESGTILFNFVLKS